MQPDVFLTDPVLNHAKRYQALLWSKKRKKESANLCQGEGGMTFIYITSYNSINGAGVSQTESV